MAVNSEGIYATRPWKIYGEGPSTKVKIETGNFNEDKQKDLTAEDVRFTTKGSTLYAFVMGWPEKEAVVQALGLASPQNPGKIQQSGIAGLQGRTQVEAGRSRIDESRCPRRRSPMSAITLKVELA